MGPFFEIFPETLPFADFFKSFYDLSKSFCDLSELLFLLFYAKNKFYGIFGEEGVVCCKAVMAD